MKNYLRLVALIILSYVSTTDAWAQLKTGAEGLHVKAGTILSSDGLVLNPSADLTWSDLTLEKSTTAFTCIGGSGITRVYNFNTPTTFSGILGFYYLTGELNGNAENSLQLAYKSAGSDGSYAVATGTSVNTTTKYLEKAFTTTAFSTLSAADPAFFAGSANADLSAIVLSSGTLAPVFAAGTLSYSASVSNDATSITLSPTVADITATVKVNGTLVTSGSASGSISLNVGTNIINAVVTAQDGTTLKTYSLIVTRAPSNNADLSAIALSSGTLAPVFSSGTLSYTASVSNSIASISLNPTVADVTATVKVNGTLVTSGSASGTINLLAGANIITTEVTAQDGTTKKTYSIIVTRAPSNNADLTAIALSSGTLVSTFSAGTVRYAASVSNATTSITLNPMVADVSATVKVNGAPVAIGSASGSINLAVGANIIPIEVTAQDGTTIKTYSIIVTRAPSDNAALSAIALSSGTLAPVFSSGTLAYTASVSNSIASITLNPTVADLTATVKVNGTLVASGSASAGIALNVGVNIINTIVIAQDGTTMKTYSLMVTRAPSSNADLSAIALNSGTLAPVFAAGTQSYTVSVGFETFSITLMPTLTDTTARVKVNGRLVASGSPSESISLSFGNNTIITEVTAQDSTLKTYTLSLNRAFSSDASLSSFSISKGELNPAFEPGTTSYKTYVNNIISSINITPVATSVSATVKVNGTPVVSGSVSAGIPLAVGINIINTVVTSGDGTVTKSYSLKVIRVHPDQILTDQSGDAAVNNTLTEVVVISETKPIVVKVPVGVTTSPSIAYGDLIAQGTGTIPQTTVTSSFAEMEIPPATTITASNPGWDGVLITPTITSYTIPAIPGQIITPGLIIEVGSPYYSLSFDKAVRLELTGQAGMRIARVHNSVYTEILATGPEDSQVAGDALPADGSFKINVGADAIIWTKVFSTFISFNQKTDLNVALVNADKSELTAELIKASNVDLSTIRSTLILPLAGSFGSTITWTSSNPSVVSADGKTITRPLFGSGNITVTLTATINKGLITETKSFIIIVRELANQAPTLTALINQAICANTSSQSIALGGISGGPESSQTTTLSLASDKPAMFSQLAIVNGELSYKLIPGASGVVNITVTVKDNGGTADGGNDTFSRIFMLTVNSLPVGVISSNIGYQISKGSTAVLSVPLATGTSYSWANAAGISGVQDAPALTVRPGVNTTYTLAITNSTGCVAYRSFTVVVMEDLKALDINNILTPNGDGKNDFLVIKNLDMYPVNTLKIFDRAGRQILMRVNYQNDWNGSFNGSPLSEDTYYYIVDFGPGKTGLKGYVSIVK